MNFWNSLLNGESGIDYLTQLNVDGYSCKIGGEIKKFDPLNYMDKKESKRLAKNSQFAVAASMEAISNAEMDLNNFERSNIGVLIGSGSGGTIPETEKESIKLFNENRNTITQYMYQKCCQIWLHQMLAGFLIYKDTQMQSQLLVLLALKPSAKLTKLF